MNVGIIGEGKFGQAIGSLLEYNGVPYEYADKGKSLTRHADLIFLMVPTQFIRASFKDNAAFITSKTVIVNGAKGIEEKTHLLPRQIVKSIGRYPHYYSLIGPTFAQGIRVKDPTITSLGYKDLKYVNIIKELIQTPYFRVHATPGYPALELASAMKNLYAILCGYAHGLGHGMNTQALLITLAVQEFTALSDAMSFNHYDVISPGIAGDLVLTCSSRQSRNFTFGLYLAKTDKKTALRKVDDTVEGYYTSQSIKVLAAKYKVDLPLALLALELIDRHRQGPKYFKSFIATL